MLTNKFELPRPAPMLSRIGVLLATVLAASCSAGAGTDPATIDAGVNTTRGHEGLPCNDDGSCDDGTTCSLGDRQGVCANLSGDTAYPGPCGVDLPAQKAEWPNFCKYRYDESGRLSSAQYFADNGEVTDVNMHFEYADDGTVVQLTGDAIWSDGFGGCDDWTWTFNQDGTSLFDLVNDDCQGGPTEFALRRRSTFLPGADPRPLSRDCDEVFSYLERAAAHLLRDEEDRGDDGSIDAISTYTYGDEENPRVQNRDRGDDGSIDETRTFTYDAEGRLLNDEELEYEYDASGRLVLMRAIEESGFVTDTRLFYDAAGNLIVAQTSRFTPPDSPTSNIARDVRWYDYSCYE